MTSSSRNDLPLLGSVIHGTGVIRLAMKKSSRVSNGTHESFRSFYGRSESASSFLSPAFSFQALSDVSPGTSANHLISDATRSTPAGGFPVFHIRGIVTPLRLNIGRKPLKFFASRV